MDPPLPLGQFQFGAQGDQQNCGSFQSSPATFFPYPPCNSLNSLENEEPTRCGDEFSDFASPTLPRSSPALIDVVGCEEGQNLAGNLKLR